MKRLMILAAVAFAAAPAVAATQGLWCAIRPSDLVFEAADAKAQWVLNIVIDNKTGAAIDATKLKTSLLIDGAALPNWNAIVSAGANPVWHAVPTGKYLPFGIELSASLRKPGYHTLKLTGDCASNEVRVMTAGVAKKP